MPELDHTHDARRRSWVDTANRPGADFPVQNLPHGVFVDGDGQRRGGVAIGDRVLDIGAALAAGLVAAPAREAAAAAAEPVLNRLLAMGPQAATGLRHALFDLLAADGAGAAGARAQAGALLRPMATVQVALPVAIGAFTDFMTSHYHIAAGRSARPARPLAPAFPHLPIGYNGRASTVTEDGVGFPRPWGQVQSDAEGVAFVPTRELDFELEVGAYVGAGSTLGERVPLEEAEAHLFGYCLVNDWSARDVQRWEARLGPFLGKSFRTTVSPWIVTADALRPFRVAPRPRTEAGLPEPPPYLDGAAHRRDGAIDLALAASVRTARMREAGEPPAGIAATNLLHTSWSFAQMLAHQTSGGCDLRPGDLVASGTASGPGDAAAACLLERTAGHLPVALPNGEERIWIEDGDEVILTARAEREGFVGIGFGACGARVLPAR